VSLFLEILLRITLPIIVLVGLGYLLQPRLKFDVGTLNRLVVYVVLPCFLIYYLATASVPLTAAGFTAAFTVVQFFVLAVLGWSIATALRLTRGRTVVTLAAALPNSGNYGLPLVQLAFGSDYILQQAVIVALHAILVTSVGVVLLSYGRGGVVQSVRAAFRTPILPAVVIGLLIKLLGLKLPAPALLPLQVLGNALTPLALFTLGAQLATTRWSTMRLPLTTGLLLRLLVAPVLTWVAVSSLGVQRGLADLLTVVASLPVAALVWSMCMEYRQDEDLASALVFVSTLLSPLTVTLAIFATRITH
jgi:malate permease and related proteins